MDICDQLFQRSHLFRHLTTQHLPQILEHAVGTKASRPLPGPLHVATRLHEKALESIDQWADKYGAYYQQVLSYNGILCICFHISFKTVLPNGLQALLGGACACGTHCSQIPNPKAVGTWYS